MRSALIAVVVCAVPARALADTSTAWDGTYERESAGGTELCQKSYAPVSIAGGKFSIVWSVNVRDKSVPVGRIEGTVQASGGIEPAVKLVDPLPPAVANMMRDLGDLNQLKSIGNNMKLSLRNVGSDRELRLSSGMCYASWTAAAPPSAPAPKPRAAPPSEPVAIDEPPEPAAAPAPSKRAKPARKPKAANRAAVAKPAKAAPPAPKAAKAVKATASTKSAAPARDGGRSGSSTPPPAKEEPRKRADGAKCRYDSDCASDSCEYRKCASQDGAPNKLGNGFACDYSSDCESDNCRNRKCASTDSREKQFGIGADCANGSECASGSCDDHKCVDD